MNAPKAKIEITSLGNVVEILPYLLGYHPENSMILHRVGPDMSFLDGPTMLAPLPDEPTEWQNAAHHFACRFAHVLERAGHQLHSGIIVYVCADPRQDDDAPETADLLRSVADQLTDTLHQHNAGEIQTFGIVADRWWAYECDLPGCCEGQPVPSCKEPDSVGAQLIRLGHPLPRRVDDIVQEFRPSEQHENTSLLTALANESEAWVDQCATPAGQDAALNATHTLLERTMGEFRAGATRLADDITARLIHGLHDEWACEHGLEYLEDDDLPHARRLWAYLARCCVPPYDEAAGPVLTLLAAVAWRQGDLPTARFALRNALALDPDDTYADALHGAINDGLDATELLAIARNGRAERLARDQGTGSNMR